MHVCMYVCIHVYNVHLATYLFAYLRKGAEVYKERTYAYAVQGRHMHSARNVFFSGSNSEHHPKSRLSPEEGIGIGILFCKRCG